MAGDILKTLRVRLISDAEDLSKGLDTAVEKVRNVGQSLTSVGSTLTKGITLPIAGIGAAAFKMAAEAEESANKFNVVMGGAADEARLALEELTATIPLTRSEMEKMAGGIQDMLVPMGVARERAAGMSVDMVALAGDLGSFNDVGTEEVLQAIQSALAGSSEPMLRFGVDTRVATLRALALSEGLIKEGEELDNTTRAMTVMMAIQRDSSDAMGDAAETVESTSNQMRFLWREIKKAGETIGKELIPVVTPLISHLRSLVERFNDLSPRTQKLILAFSGVGAALGPVLVALGTALTLLPQMVAGIKLVGLALQAGFIGTTAPIALAAAAIGVIVLVGKEVIEHWDVLSYEAGRLVSAVKEFFVNMADRVTAVVSAMVERVREFFVGGFTKVVDAVAGQIERVKNFFGGLADQLVGNSIVTDMVAKIVSQFGMMGEQMVLATDSATVGVTDYFSNMSEDVAADTTTATSSVVSSFGSMRDGVLSHTQDVLGKVGDLFSEFGIDLPKEIDKTVTDIAGKWGKIKQVIEIPTGDTLGKSLEDWKAWALEIVDILKKVWDKVKGWISGLSSAMQSGGIGTININQGMGGSGTVPIIGPGNIGQFTTTYEWAQTWVHMENANRYLAEIAANTAGLAAGDTGTPGRGGGGSGGVDAAAIDQGLDTLVSRQNRAAGYVDY